MDKACALLDVVVGRELTGSIFRRPAQWGEKNKTVGHPPRRVLLDSSELHAANHVISDEVGCYIAVKDR